MMMMMLMTTTTTTMMMMMIKKIIIIGNDTYGQRHYDTAAGIGRSRSLVPHRQRSSYTLVRTDSRPADVTAQISRSLSL